MYVHIYLIPIKNYCRQRLAGHKKKASFSLAFYFLSYVFFVGAYHKVAVDI